MSRYFINTNPDNEEFRWIYISNVDSSGKELELYHEFTRSSRTVAKSGYLQLTEAHYKVLGKLVVNDIGDEESTQNYNRIADQFINERSTNNE